MRVPWVSPVVQGILKIGFFSFYDYRARLPLFRRCRQIVVRRRFESTKPTELRFSALLTEGNARVRFYREGFDRLKEDLA